jgi:hypothetical protein
MEAKPTENLNNFQKFKKNLKEFHTKKPYIEFFTALLTVPVLVTVIYLNINNIKGSDKTPEVKGEETKTMVITQPSEKITEKEIVITKEACEPGIGDIVISSPDEGDIVSSNPVFIDIDYEENGYCNIVWSYKINEGEWSNFDDRSIALNNLKSGDIKLELRVKSVVNSDTKTLTRRFIYDGTEEITPSANPITLTPAPIN